MISSRTVGILRLAILSFSNGRGQIDVADIGEDGLHYTAEIERLNVGVFFEDIFRYLCCRMRIVNGKEGRGYFASKPKKGGSVTAQFAHAPMEHGSDEMRRKMNLFFDGCKNNSIVLVELFTLYAYACHAQM